MRHLILFFISSFIFHFSFAQDLNGVWEGTTTYLGKPSSLKMNIKQDGVLLEGKASQKSTDKKSSATFTFEGIIDGEKIRLKSLAYEEKEGAWCLAKFVLEFSESGDRQLLEGKWKPNTVPGGCLMGASGKTALSRKKPSALPAVQPVVVSAPVNTEFKMDEEGEYLVEALKERKYYALIIGVSNYTDEAIVDLDEPVGDALVLKSVLERNYTFEDENIYFLQDPTRTEIIEAFDELSLKVTSTDQLLIFYAGHGIWDNRLEQGFWLPSNARKNSKAEWISNGTIRDYIRAIDSKHTLLVADACFSGGILKERAAFLESRAMLELYKMPSRKAMTSGTLTTVPDQSVFIEYLVKNLEQNQLPVITAEQLFSKFKIAVINNSPNGQVPQYGVIHQADDEGGDFLFLKR